MQSQVLALSFTSRNKEKKKEVTGWKPKGWKRARSIEEDRYNVVLELLIKEEKKNKIHQLSFGKDEDKHFDLVVESQTSKQFESECNNEQNSITPKSTKNVYSSEPVILTKL